MGSTSPPSPLDKTPAGKAPQQQPQEELLISSSNNNQTQQDPATTSAEPELRRLLELRDKEIRELKLQIVEYKAALESFKQLSTCQETIKTSPGSKKNESKQQIASSSSSEINDPKLSDKIQQIFTTQLSSTTTQTSNSSITTNTARINQLQILTKHIQDESDGKLQVRNRHKSMSDIKEEEGPFTKSNTGYSADNSNRALGVANSKAILHDDNDKIFISPVSVKQSLKSSLSATNSRVLFHAGADDDDDDDNDDHNNGRNNNSDNKVEFKIHRTISENNIVNQISDVNNDNSNDNDDNDAMALNISDVVDDIDDFINDVSEIDLNLDLHRKHMIGNEQNDSNVVVADDDVDNDEEDDDIISDGLLTSLTDAAISNLSQLAALQERCESQQHSNNSYQQSHQTASTQLLSNDPTSNSISLVRATSANSQATVQTGVGGSPFIGHLNQSRANSENNFSLTQDAFSANTIANQAAIAINAAAAAESVVNINQSSPIVSHNQPISSPSSISPNSTIQADLSSSHSLASVVAAAAIAAAAANDQRQQQNQSQQVSHHHQQHHQTQLNPQSRLTSSSISSSPEFYSHSIHAINLQQQQQQQHLLSSLHFSPSTSVTPSSSSLLAQSRRSVASNTSSNLISPISSPNYLRRQFMTDRLPLMSPSPSSGLTTGTSSSGASTSLAHLLSSQPHPQRSVCALGNSTILTSTSSTPLSACGTGSSTVSPLMNNKNSSQARLNNMQIRHKFGYLGSGRAQFNSPHGFCLGLNQEIVVADTNNHRVCIFDKSGTYINQFGSPGKEDGQLWNPRKVAILHRATNNLTGHQGNCNNSNIFNSSHQQLNSSYNKNQLSSYSDHISSYGSHISSQTSSTIVPSNGEPLYVVCDRGAERSRMQLFTKDGAFIKKIGIHYIDIVAGLAITQDGLIIVVDSVSPTVYIINGETGVLNGWFDCSNHMKEPSDIAVKSDDSGNEYFICDFKGHCVVVFSEQGEYLRKIGHDGLTSYPNGIDISDDGDILVGDSHGNRFHVVVFDRNGNFVSQFECPHVKVSRCCGLKITREGYIVTLAKNNHHVLVLDTIHI